MQLERFPFNTDFLLELKKRKINLLNDALLTLEPKEPKQFLGSEIKIQLFTSFFNDLEKIQKKYFHESQGLHQEKFSSILETCLGCSENL